MSGRIARAARAIAVDAGILRRRRELRLLIVGQSISDLGSMITFVARGQQPAARSAAVGAVRRGALIAACTAIRRPPLDALLPRLVEREELKSASALQWAIHDTASMAGPAIGGVLIATAGAAVTYTADLVTFGVSPRRARVDADAAAPGGPVARDARDRRGAVLRALAAMLPRFVAYDSRRGADAHPDVIEAM